MFSQPASLENIDRIIEIAHGVITSFGKETGRADGSDTVQVNCQSERHGSYTCAVLKINIPKSNEEIIRAGDKLTVIYYEKEGREGIILERKSHLGVPKFKNLYPV